VAGIPVVIVFVFETHGVMQGARWVNPAILCNGFADDPITNSKKR
jgi:hypothetical protein